MHIIGGWGNKHHLKYNDTTQKIEKLHDLTEQKIMDNPLQHHRLIQVKDKLLMFGGYNGYIGGSDVDRIYEYDASKNEWSTIPVKMPFAGNSFGCTTIFNDEFVLLIGGRTNMQWKSDEIWIYSVQDQKFRKSKITCPRMTSLDVITISDPETDKMVVVGFIRNIWREYDMNQHLFPPPPLIKMISTYYSNEYVHLLETDSLKHWRIDAWKIM